MNAPTCTESGGDCANGGDHGAESNQFEGMRSKNALLVRFENHFTRDASLYLWCDELVAGRWQELDSRVTLIKTDVARAARAFRCARRGSFIVQEICCAPFDSPRLGYCRACPSARALRHEPGSRSDRARRSHRCRSTLHRERRRRARNGRLRQHERRCSSERRWRDLRQRRRNLRHWWQLGR